MIKVALEANMQENIGQTLTAFLRSKVDEFLTSYGFYKSKVLITLNQRRFMEEESLLELTDIA
jgi:hypothetical protein